jgi:hypothetical protein
VTSGAVDRTACRLSRARVRGHANAGPGPQSTRSSTNKLSSAEARSRRHEHTLVLALARSNEPPNPGRCAPEPQNHPDSCPPAKARPNAIDECPGGRQYVYADQDHDRGDRYGRLRSAARDLPDFHYRRQEPQQAAGIRHGRPVGRKRDMRLCAGELREGHVHNASVTPPSHQVVITRPSGKYRDRIRRYRIEVDGSRAGTIGSSEELVIPIATGTHTVQARIDWTGSPQVSIAVTEEHSPRLVVRPAGSAAMGLLQIFGICQPE